MLLIYTPEDQAAQHLEFRPGRVRLDEQARIERLYSRESGTKTSFELFVQDVKDGGSLARRVLLFTMLRRQHPQIRFEDVNPFGDEVEIRLHRAELEEIYGNVERTTDFPGRDAYLARLRMEIDDAPDSQEPGKATGTSSTPTSSASSSSTAARSPRRGRSTS